MSSAEKQAVALSSMAASALMTIGKFAVGFMTGSLGLVSEGLHSFLDFGATVLTFMAVRISDRPADDTHPYGHGKVESMAALAETALLFITSFWIIYEAADRLLSGKIEVEATWWSVAVIVVSIVIDLSRAGALKKVAKKTKSQALEADALHFSSDVLSSGVVLLGLGLVALGWPKGDALAAIGVSLFVCHAGWVMGKRTIDTLIDTVPAGASERMCSLIESVPGVAGVSRVRVRPAGNIFFVEADIAVGRGLSQDRVAGIRQKIVDTVHAQSPEAEVSIATHPLALNNETVQQRVAIIAANHGANVHHITAHHSKGRLSVGFDLEVEGWRSIQEAHEIASKLEADMRAEFGEDAEVETHLEPLQDRGIDGVDVDPQDLALIKSQLEMFLAETGSLHSLHKVRARKTDVGMLVFFHCRTNSDRTVSEIHETVDAFERKIRQKYPEVFRVLAHVEPERSREG
ncbi:MAG: cation diffusion facilitator family transporter [Alphaproteobacteria bacterium]|nr:cation diffusion facilitator family transporter [Alphaproteobacteria bacterium]